MFALSDSYCNFLYDNILLCKCEEIQVYIIIIFADIEILLGAVCD